LSQFCPTQEQRWHRSDNNENAGRQEFVGKATQSSQKALTPAKFAEYRDQRLKRVVPGTVVRELAYFSSIINHGRREWGIHANNPVALVRKPTQLKGRDRVLSPAEREKLLIELLALRWGASTLTAEQRPCT
jgi:integrase